MGNNCYLVHTWDIDELNEDAIISMADQFNYANKLDISIEEFKERLRIVNPLGDKYTDSCELNSVFMFGEDANKAVSNNIMDINDGGSFNFASVSTITMGSMYAACQPSDVIVYQYIPDTDKYEEISEENDVYKYISHSLGVMSRK